MSLQRDFHAERCALRHAIDRCHNDNHPHYRNYGERGVQVCREWRDPMSGFPAFFVHIGPRPGPEYSLDRIDNNDGYRPGNVRWADRPTQQRNRRQKSYSIRDYGWGTGHSGRKHNPSPLIEYQGKLQTVTDWSAETGLRPATIRQRVDRGWPWEKVFDPRLYNPKGKHRSDQ